MFVATDVFLYISELKSKQVFCKIHSKTLVIHFFAIVLQYYLLEFVKFKFQTILKISLNVLTFTQRFCSQCTQSGKLFINQMRLRSQSYACRIQSYLSSNPIVKKSMLISLVVLLPTLTPTFGTKLTNLMLTSPIGPLPVGLLPIRYLPLALFLIGLWQVGDLTIGLLQKCSC